jgi:hypothetical protein
LIDDAFNDGIGESAFVGHTIRGPAAFCGNMHVGALVTKLRIHWQAIEDLVRPSAEVVEQIVGHNPGKDSVAIVDQLLSATQGVGLG